MAVRRCTVYNESKNKSLEKFLKPLVLAVPTLMAMMTMRPWDTMLRNRVMASSSLGE